MRNFAVLMLLVCSACAGSMTSVPESERSLPFVSPVTGLEQSVAFERALLWVQENFTTVDNAIVHADKEQQQFAARGRIDYPCSGVSCATRRDWHVYFDMLVKVDQGQVRSLFRNLTLSSPSSSSNPGMQGPVWSQRDIDAIQPELQRVNEEMIGAIKR